MASNLLWLKLNDSSSYLKRLSNQTENSIINCSKHNLIHNLFRSILVVVSFLFSILIPKIDLFLGLFGSVSASTIALIFPALLDLVLFWQISKYSLAKLFKILFIILFGIYIFIAGLYNSIYDLIEDFNASKNN